MNFAQIRAFHHVAKEGGVARAAAVLGVSQPTISQHLKGLEERHGVRLFEREGRGLRLTPAGQDLLSVTEKLLRAAEEVDDALRRPISFDGGRLRLLSDSTALAVDLIGRLRQRHPSIEVSLQIASVPRIIPEIEQAAADAGITTAPPASDDLLIEPMRCEAIWVTAPRGHRFERMGSVPLKELNGENVVMREAGSRTRATMERAFEDEGVAPRIALEIGERSAIREAVARGLGVAFFVPSECPPDARLVHAPLRLARGRLEFDEYLVMRRDRSRQPVLAAFRDVASRFSAEQGLGWTPQIR